MINPPPAARDDHSGPCLIATRGLPGAGKTTWALEQLASRPHGTIARCNRDDLRRMIHGEPRYDAESEAIVTLIQHRAIRALLDKGQSVIVDDTNLHPVHFLALAVLADQAEVPFTVQDFTTVPLETCIRRDWHRKDTPAHVGENVIRDMHDRYLTDEAQ